MTQAEMERGFEEVWRLFAETSERFKETDIKFKETAERIKETDKKIENLIGRWSLFVEGLVVPAAQKLFRERGIELDQISQRVKVSRNGKEGLEIDVLGVNGEYAVLIEAKSTLEVHDVNEHIERLNKFKKLMPEYADRKVVGAVAGIVISEDADKYAYKKGLFVIAQSGDTVKILNDEKFKPKEW